MFITLFVFLFAPNQETSLNLIHFIRKHVGIELLTTGCSRALEMAQDWIQKKKEIIPVNIVIWRLENWWYLELSAESIFYDEILFKI